MLPDCRWNVVPCVEGGRFALSSSRINGSARRSRNLARSTTSPPRPIPTPVPRPIVYHPSCTGNPRSTARFRNLPLLGHPLGDRLPPP